MEYTDAMRYLLLVFTVSAMVLCAQDPPAAAPARGGGGGPPKNLKVLKPEEVRMAMGAAVAGLGVQCGECHVADRSSDEKPMKVTARMMFEMTKDINAKFPDGKAHVSCFTCHRAQKEPLMAAPAAAPAQ
jgi:hypothetical protein